MSTMFADYGENRVKSQGFFNLFGFIFLFSPLWLRLPGKYRVLITVHGMVPDLILPSAKRRPRIEMHL